MAALVAWLAAHWGHLLAALTAALGLASAITALTKTPKDDEVVRKIAAWLSFLQPKTSGGTLKLPGSSPAPEVEVPFGRLEESSRPDAERLDG